MSCNTVTIARYGHRWSYRWADNKRILETGISFALKVAIGWPENRQLKIAIGEDRNNAGDRQEKIRETEEVEIVW